MRRNVRRLSREVADALPRSRGPQVPLGNFSNAMARPDRDRDQAVIAAVAKSAAKVAAERANVTNKHKANIKAARKATGLRGGQGRTKSVCVGCF